MNGIKSNCSGYYSGCCNCKNTNPTLDPLVVINQFLTEYYKNTSCSGWNTCQYLFDQNCAVLCKSRIVGNAHDLLAIFSSEYVKRANYDQLRTKWVLINQTTLLINVFGKIQFVGFTESVSSVVPFSESFILSLNQSNGIIKCTHHLIDW